MSEFYEKQSYSVDEPQGAPNDQYNAPFNDNFQPPRPPKKSGGAAKVIAIILAAAIGGGAAGAVSTGIVMKNSTPAQQTAVEEKAYDIEELPLDKSLLSVTGDKSLTPQQVYERNVNSVVGIRTEATTKNIWGQTTLAACSGTGFILSEEGYIVTNAHVIANAQSIKVTLYSGETYDAALIGSFEDNDVALLKIEAEGLQAATIGSSSDLKVGEQVVAIGNPLGELTYTMTVGYVSAKDREFNAEGTPINMIQTDVAINSGNSGGPLFDMNGNVVGITSGKYSGQSSSGAMLEGLGFAIPIDDVLDYIYDIESYGYVKNQAYLGISVSEDLTQATAEKYGLPMGVLVGSVEDGGCAAKAGLKKGDIILKLGDKEIDSYSSLKTALRKHKAGEQVDIQYYRNGQTITVTATLGEKKVETAEQPQTQQQPQQQEQQEQQDSDSYFNPFDFFNIW